MKDSRHPNNLQRLLWVVEPFVRVSKSVFGLKPPHGSRLASAFDPSPDVKRLVEQIAVVVVLQNLSEAHLDFGVAREIVGQGPKQGGRLTVLARRRRGFSDPLRAS